ncbi:MAG: hypothetical protein JWM86_2266 [Thermoleophilia bacterium]|nr:hypothetical protein [Thermoleophilia bacterium]
MDDAPQCSPDDPPGSLRRRLSQLIVSQLVLGAGVALLLDSQLGSDGFSMFVNGARLTLGVPFVVINTVVSLTLIAIAWVRGRRPGLGTLTHAVVVGTTVSLLLPVLPGPDVTTVRVLELLLAFVALSVGVAAYVAVDLGAGPLEAAALSMDPPLRFGVAYTLLQLAGAVAGWSMGADVGAGTVLVVLCVGPVVDRLTPVFKPGTGGT